MHNRNQAASELMLTGASALRAAGAIVSRGRLRPVAAIVMSTPADSLHCGSTTGSGAAHHAASLRATAESASCARGAEP